MMTIRPQRRRASVGLIVLSLALAHTSQSQSPTQAARAVPTSRREVRAELAATLLNANRFSEAVTEYRRLLATDPGNHEYRLALARALAWGDHPREAERELLIARDRRNAVVVDPLLRSVRSAFDPTAGEASVWVREAPDYLPYRVALARALAREDPRRAIAQFDTLRLAALAGQAQAPPEAMLIREEADAYNAIGAHRAAIALLGSGLAAAPSDTGLRHSLATALFDAQMFDASRAEYDTLIAMAPSATAFVGRANAALALHDTSSATDDLGRSITLKPNYEAYYLLASLARDHEDFGSARLLYDAARRAAPDASSKREVAAARAELAREVRPVVAFAPALGGDPGWTMTTQSAADNSHVSYVAVDASRIVPLADDFVGNVSFGMRRIAQGSAVGAPDTPSATGSAASLGVARQITAGRVTFGGAAQAGFVAHPGITTFGTGSLTLGGWFDAWAFGLGASREPAYESLFTPAALSPREGETPALIARTTTISSAGPIGPVDAAASLTHTGLSDGNASESFDAYARLPLSNMSPYLSAVYEANVISYSASTTLYWDPVHYTSNAFGPELATRHAHGLSLAARVLAGLASDVERDTTTTTPGPAPQSHGKRGTQPAPRETQRETNTIRRSALQLSTGAEASYRAAWFEAAADVAYGRARAGGYQRLGATVTLRVLR